MASVHIRDVMRWLAADGQLDADPRSGEFFLEIRFDESDAHAARDNEFVNKVITADSPQGIATIVFDKNGQLRSLDLS